MYKKYWLAIANLCMDDNIYFHSCQVVFFYFLKFLQTIYETFLLIVYGYVIMSSNMILYDR